MIEIIKEQCPSLVTDDENKEVVLANIKRAITDVFRIVFDTLIESAITAYDDTSFSCTHGILNRLKLNLKTEGLESVDTVELLLQNMGVMSTYDHSIAPFFSLFAGNVVVYDPEQAEFNPGAYANDIYERVFVKNLTDVSVPDAIRGYIESFQDKVSVLQNPQKITKQKLQELEIEIYDEDEEEISTPGFLGDKLKSQFVKGLSQEINNLFIKSKPVTQEEQKSALKLKLFANLKKHLDISDEALNKTENVREFLQEKIINYINNGDDKIKKTRALRRDFLMLRITSSNLDNGEFDMDAIMKKIETIAKINRGEVNIKLKDAQEILNVDAKKLKPFCSLCFTEEKEVYIEKFKQELLNKGYPVAFTEILDVDSIYELIEDMTYGQIETGYETRLESLKEQLFSSAQQRLNSAYTAAMATVDPIMTDETILNYQMLHQSGKLTDDMTTKMTHYTQVAGKSDNKVWMALHLESEREEGLRREDWVKIFKDGPSSIDDLKVDIDGHSIIWWAVNYNDREKIEKIKSLLSENDSLGNLGLEAINDLLRYNLMPKTYTIRYKTLAHELYEKYGKTKNGYRALDLAIIHRHDSIAIKLIECMKDFSPIAANMQSRYGKTPLALAICNGQEDVALKLIEKLSEIKSPADEINKPDNLGQTPLDLALYNSNKYPDVTAKLIECLIERELSANELNKPNKLGSTPLMFASAYCHESVSLELIKYLKNNGILADEINKKNNAGATVISMAIQFSKLNVVIELMKGLSAADLKDSGLSAMELNELRNSDGTLLELAIEKGNSDVAAKLIEYFRDSGLPAMELLGSSDETLLELAIEKGNSDVAAKLIEYFRDSGLPDMEHNELGNSDRTLLELAIEKCNSDVAAKLIEYFIDSGLSAMELNRPGNSDRTLLELAIEKGNSDVAAKLIEYFKDSGLSAMELNKPGNSGRTPLALAIEKGQQDVAINLINFFQCSLSEIDDIIENIGGDNGRLDEATVYAVKLVAQKQEPLGLSPETKDITTSNKKKDYQESVIDMKIVGSRQEIFEEIEKEIEEKKREVEGLVDDPNQKGPEFSSR